VDAVHRPSNPVRRTLAAARPALRDRHGVWTRPAEPARRDRLETGLIRIIEVQTVDAMSTIALFEAMERAYPAMRRIHIFLDNARYHHARIVQEWLAQPGGASSCTSSGLLSASKPDRAALVGDAQARHHNKTTPNSATSRRHPRLSAR